MPLNQTESPEQPVPQEPKKFTSTTSATSRLDPVAIIALGGTLLACCPAAAIFGVIAGLVSYFRIRSSNGSLYGSRLAVTCAITSFVVGIVSWGIGDRYQSAGRAAINSEVRMAMDQFLAGNVDPNVWWKGIDPKSLLAFQQSVRDRFGLLKTSSVTQTDIALSLKSTAQFRIMLESQSIQTVASITTDLVSDTRTFLPSIRIRSIEISMPSNPDSKETEMQMVFPPKEIALKPDTLPKT